jgi:hypothetical protein
MGITVIQRNTATKKHEANRVRIPNRNRERAKRKSPTKIGVAINNTAQVIKKAFPVPNQPSRLRLS